MITFITGGTRSGKSSYGEQLLESEKKVLYLATAKITDDEMARRVEHHKIEEVNAILQLKDISRWMRLLKPQSVTVVFLDCVGTTITNWMFDQLQ